MNRIAPIFLILLLGSFSFVYFLYLARDIAAPERLFGGVAFQGDTVAEAKLLIDRVKDYTNVF
jgi:hypothetical protein